MDKQLITDLSTLKLDENETKTWKRFFPDTTAEQTFFDGVVEAFNKKSPDVIQSINPTKLGERVSDDVKTQFEDVIDIFAELFSTTRYGGSKNQIKYELKNYIRDFYMILDKLITKNYSFQLTKQIQDMTPKQTTLCIQDFKTNILLDFYDDFVRKRNQQNESNIASQKDAAFNNLFDSTLVGKSNGGGNIRRSRSRPRRKSSSTHRRRPSRKSASTKRRRSRRPHRRTSRK
jgi:hypothetical protein